MPSVGGRLPKFPCIYLVWFGGKCVHTAGHHSGGQHTVNQYFVMAHKPYQSNYYGYTGIG